MQIEIAEHERMSESGSSLLRLIQNNDTCRLDLLVRESLQNCLDAGDKTSKSVRVDIDINRFETEEISPFFEKISRNLNEQFPGKRTLISIRDTHTVGLTGPIRYSDVKDDKFGNLLKLIYEISKPQEQSGSGGSWGLGKTVYFRIGIGLVLYYSRIRKSGPNGGYESRLAAALVEDEKGDRQLLPQSGNIRRGIAWWGEAERKNRRRTVPLTSERKIEKILREFHIRPFADDETGTVIIIPFINEKELLEEAKPTEIDNESSLMIPYWCDTDSGIQEYLKIASQRWYAPRLGNQKYRGQYLELYINGKGVTPDKMAPVFLLVQKLYNSTPDGRETFNDREISSQYITLNNTFEKGSAKAGYVSYIKVTPEDMKMLAPDNYLNPYYYVNKLSSETMYNDPIILCTRKPGMVVSYSTTGDWTDNIPKTAIGEYIIGVFVANSENCLKHGKMPLEEYIRRGEKADHMAWDDWSLNGKNPQIIARIKRNVRKKIKDDFVTITKGSEEEKNLGLGKMLADIIMPPTDFAYWDDAQGGTSGPGGTGGSGDVPANEGPGETNKTSHVILKQTAPIYFDASGINVPVRLLFGKCSEAILEMQVDSEKGTIRSIDWEKRLGKPFPIELKEFILKSVFRGKGKTVSSVLSSPVSVEAEYAQDGLNIKVLSSELYNVRDSVRIKMDMVDNIVIDGVMKYDQSNDIQGEIVLKEG